jgi:hypothetical protein
MTSAIIGTMATGYTVDNLILYYCPIWPCVPIEQSYAKIRSRILTPTRAIAYNDAMQILC